jgi:small-conductance mechanosensitive channel
MDRLKHLFTNLPDFVWNMALFGVAVLAGAIGCWFIRHLLKYRREIAPRFSFRNHLLPRVGKPFIFFLPFLLFDLMLPLLRGTPDLVFNIGKLVEILLIISFAAVLMGVVEFCEDYVVHAYDISKPDNLRERKIRTQLQFIRRLAKITIIVISFCFILLSFDNLRKLGTGLLTGVGVSGVIIGFAAQKSLSGFLAGFQIAFTQPIRIDDVLIVEGEWGRVDEITLTYVVLKLWDKRNLVIPINYFIEKPFQNWTRTSATLVASVFMYLDFTVPVNELRNEVTELLLHTPLWDKVTNVVQVTNFSEKTVEIRVLVSAGNSADAFDLRCYIREGLLNYVTRNYPEALPYARINMAKQ